MLILSIQRSSFAFLGGSLLHIGKYCTFLSGCTVCLQRGQFCVHSIFRALEPGGHDFADVAASNGRWATAAAPKVKQVPIANFAVFFKR